MPSNLLGLLHCDFNNSRALQFFEKSSFITFIFSVAFFNIAKAATGLSAVSGLFLDQKSSNFLISSSNLPFSFITLFIIEGIFSSISLLFFFKIWSNLLHSLSN